MSRLEKKGEREGVRHQAARLNCLFLLRFFVLLAEATETVTFRFIPDLSLAILCSRHSANRTPKFLAFLLRINRRCI